MGCFGIIGFGGFCLLIGESVSCSGCLQVSCLSLFECGVESSCIKPVEFTRLFVKITVVRLIAREGAVFQPHEVCVGEGEC